MPSSIFEALNPSKKGVAPRSFSNNLEVVSILDQADDEVLDRAGHPKGSRGALPHSQEAVQPLLGTKREAPSDLH